MSDLDLQEVLQFAVEVAKQAGKMILKASDSRASFAVETKKSAVDLLTEADQAVEEMVKKTISSKYPSHKFIGEETSAAGQCSILDDSPTWIVDPIDGTTNFVHGIPYVAISIGFTLFTRPTVGVILNPFRAQLYTGIHARGSFLTTLSPDLSESISVARLPLRPPSTLELRSSIIAIEYGSERVGPNFECKLNTFKNLTSLDRGMVHSLHAYGCASLNVCMVASGYLDAYWDGGPWEWDFCAGCVILEEAGGSLVDGNPREGPDSMELPDLCGRVYLAVRQGRSADEKTKWVKEFWSLMEGRLKFER